MAYKTQEHRTLRTGFLAIILTLTVPNLEAVSEFDTGRQYWQFPSNGVKVSPNPESKVKAMSAVQCGGFCSFGEFCSIFCYDVSSQLCHQDVTQSTSPADATASTLFCYKFERPCILSQGYFNFGPYCLKLNYEPLNYFEARDNCTYDGAHLYHMKTVADSDILDEFLDSAPYRVGALWMGANDVQVEGYFVWSDGTHLNVSSEMWDSGEPNDHDDEDCVTNDVPEASAGHDEAWPADASSTERVNVQSC